MGTGASGPNGPAGLERPAASKSATDGEAAKGAKARRDARGGARGAKGAVGRRPVAGLVLLIVSALLAVAAPGAAQAATATGCKGRKVRTLPFSTGSVQLFRDGGYLCAVTVQKHPGTRRLVAVSLQARGLRAVAKSRRDTRSSPPARVYAGHRYVRVTGLVTGGSYRSAWFRC
ncbi:hypothetical protein [Streptomyces sp. NPDC048481]|uniref:hypothetical protein n=1 Tax=Streptomyces sp. NPDC048481 TaxID=3365557 RepID=UPI00371CD157